MRQLHNVIGESLHLKKTITEMRTGLLLTKVLHPQAVLFFSAPCGPRCASLIVPQTWFVIALCWQWSWEKEGHCVITLSEWGGGARGQSLLRPPCALIGSVFLGPLSLYYVFLPLLFFLLLSVTCLNHLGQFPGQQRAGNEERRESQYDSGEETVWVFGSPLHHILCPCSYINHAVYSSNKAQSNLKSGLLQWGEQKQQSKQHDMQRNSQYKLSGM